MSWFKKRFSIKTVIIKYTILSIFCTLYALFYSTNLFFGDAYIPNEAPSVVIAQQADLNKVTTNSAIKDIPTSNTVNADVTKLYESEFDHSKGFVSRIYPAIDKKRTYFAIGDSIMVGSASRIYKSLGEEINIDAKVGRQFSAAKGLLEDYKNRGLIGDNVIIHLGTNGEFSKDALRATLNIVKDCKKIFLVNIKVPRAYEEQNNTLLDEIRSEYPNVSGIDWHSISINSQNSFVNDGMHLTSAGCTLYSKLLVSALTGD